MVSEDPINRFSHFVVRPQLLEQGKVVQGLVRDGVVSCSVQVIAGGGETNLHAHRGRDGIFFVLQGSARFYTTEDRVVADVGKNEGLLIPREVPYWFESSSDENLVVLLFTGQVLGEPSGRIDYEPSKLAQAREVDGVQHLPETKVLEGVFFGG